MCPFQLAFKVAAPCWSRRLECSGFGMPYSGFAFERDTDCLPGSRKCYNLRTRKGNESLETGSEMWAPSLRDSGSIVAFRNPTLKRGANDHCAYGASKVLQG